MSLPELRCLLCDRVLLDENAAVPSERCLQCGKLMRLNAPEHPSVPPGEQAGVMPGEGSLLTTPFDELPEAVPVVQPHKVPPVLRVSEPTTPRDVPVVLPRSEPPLVRPASPKWEPPIQMHPPVPPHEDDIVRPKPKYGCALVVLLAFALLALLAVTFVIYAIARGLRKLPKTEATPTKVVETTPSKADKPKPLVPEVAAASTQSIWIPPRGTFPVSTATISTNATILLPGVTPYGVQAGSGRFILFPAPEARMVAVFDVATASTVGYLPMPDDKSLVAGSANHAFIVSPAQRTISRYDLITLKMEMAGLLPDDIGKPLAVAVGSAARGPVYLLGAVKEPSLHLLNPDTLATLDWKPAEIPFKKPSGVFTGGVAGQRAYLRTSASGRVLLGGVAIGQQNYRVDRLDLVGAEPAISPTDIKIADPAFPTADGGDGAFAAVPNPKITRFPMAEGSGYFEIADKAGGKVLTMTFPGESRVQRAEVKGIEDFADAAGPDRDRRAFLIPSAQALVYLRSDGKSVQWRRVKVSDELPKLTQDYLVVTSTPPAVALRGSTFNHVLKILGSSSGAVLKLDTAPPAMKVEGESLVWDVPADQPLGDVPVEVSVESKLKPEVSTKLRFTLSIVATVPIRTSLFAPKPAEGRAVRIVKAGAAGDPLLFIGQPLATAKRGQTYRTAIALGTPADTNLSIEAGPPGLNWKGSDLVWEVPADFPGGPVPVVLTAQTATDRRVSFGFLIDVGE